MTTPVVAPPITPHFTSVTVPASITDVVCGVDQKRIGGEGIEVPWIEVVSPALPTGEKSIVCSTHTHTHTHTHTGLESTKQFRTTVPQFNVI